MNNPLISVIIPVYNCAKWLSTCIESILNQDESDFELILVNDGSKDGSGDICRNYADQNPCIVYVEQPNKGVAAARNNGLSKACGRFITFADSDDWLEPNAFSTCLDTISRTDADMVKFGYHIERSGEKAKTCTIDKIMVFNGINGLLEYTDKVEYHAFVWNMFSKREVTCGLSFNEEINWLEDQIFGYKCFMACRRIVYIPDTLYHYRYWDDHSLSSVQSPKVIAAASRLEHELKILLTHEDAYRENIDDEYRWRLEFLVNTLYSTDASYNLRRNLAHSVEPLQPLKLREGRIFFNDSRPFILNDLILRAIFRLKKLSQHKRATRV
ncbi:glycosyltransferase family 2 protein [Alistipes provencensis]|uniref:glycosyltransferase family 2 protein n=1 Tax=Alistipes provencensis TaxID=1816676 RepID=UPI0007ED5353|nr:glycosyltransferase family 2 protein [Alistipes provencensis]